jgi:hypothetical protein
LAAGRFFFDFVQFHARQPQQPLGYVVPLDQGHQGRDVIARDQIVAIDRWIEDSAVDIHLFGDGDQGRQRRGKFKLGVDRRSRRFRAQAGGRPEGEQASHAKHCAAILETGFRAGTHGSGTELSPFPSLIHANLENKYGNRGSY